MFVEKNEVSQDKIVVVLENVFQRVILVWKIRDHLHLGIVTKIDFDKKVGIVEVDQNLIESKEKNPVYGCTVIILVFVIDRRIV